MPPPLCRGVAAVKVGVAVVVAAAAAAAAAVAAVVVAGERKWALNCGRPECGHSRPHRPPR